MRTTIEISDHHRGMLLALAAKRGIRGYSEIIQEALDHYMESQTRQMEMKEKVLEMKGSWQEEETGQVRSRLLELREKWNIS